MSEVKNVTITVPVGLNGWQQEGSVVINGMKVEFPVGVETEVPETAAALLKELIEAAEKRAENVPANNDYKGSLTVPAGHTLHVEKGANFLNYGESVETTVILPETAMHKTEDKGHTVFLLTTRPTVPCEHGKTYGIIYNGAVHECVAIDIGTALDGVANGQIVLGNGGASGMPDIPGFNPDAPFYMHAVYDGIPDGEVGTTYGMLIPLDDAEAVTLSITEKVNVASGGVVTAHATITDLAVDRIALEGCDMSLADLNAAYISGKTVQIMCSNETRVLRGLVNASATANGSTVLQMDVPRGVLVGGFFIVGIMEADGVVTFEQIGKVVAGE